MKFVAMLCLVCSKRFDKGLDNHIKLFSNTIVMDYDTTISEITTVAKTINIQKTGSDGRIDSAMKEGPFLSKLKDTLLETHPSWEIIISPPRASCDIMINSIRINLKITECKSSDNAMNKPSMYYSMTGSTDYPYSSTWNDFLAKLEEARVKKQIKKVRERTTEYHYLVKNKETGEVLLKPIFDIHTYISNPSNTLQINWKNEFVHSEYCINDEEYIEKVQSLLKCIQKSVKEMIARTNEFAESDIDSLFK
jgi:hypothetical protein